MEKIASSLNTLSPDLPALLEGFDCPAILVSPDYRILATNAHYRRSFGEVDLQSVRHCYQVSHGYQVPCDQAGEDCPLAAAQASGRKERVLHIHHTPRGREHVDVEMLPIKDPDGNLRYFVELLKPVALARAEIDQQEMVGVSPAFNRLLAAITRVGPSEASVLLLGESGVGKELAASAIHRASPRADKPMVTLECAGLTASLFESELFGYARGAFTGATHARPGLVEAAHGGTLFLDEVGDIPLEMQVKLLRLIETGSYRAVGGRELHRADFRLVCATHKNLPAMVAAGDFRQDLYYRINVFPVHVPSLAERREDIPLLAKSILARLDGSGQYLLTDSAIHCLREHVYRGNIRELRNLMVRALVMANSHVIDGHVIRACLDLDGEAQAETLQSGAQSGNGEGGSGGLQGEQVATADGSRQVETGYWPGECFEDLKRHEQRYLRALLAHCQQDKQRAAELAGISLRSLYRKLA